MSDTMSRYNYAVISPQTCVVLAVPMTACVATLKVPPADHQARYHNLEVVCKADKISARLLVEALTIEEMAKRAGVPVPEMASTRLDHFRAWNHDVASENKTYKMPVELYANTLRQ